MMEDFILAEILSIDDNYKTDTKLYVDFLRKTEQSVSVQSLKNWIDELKASGKSVLTINRRVYAIKSRLRFLFGKSGDQSYDILKHFEVENDLKSMRKLKVNSKAVDPSKIISRDEIRILIEKSSERTGLIIEFLYTTGCRISESLGVRNSNIQRSRSYIIIRILGKGDKERMIKISIELHNRIKTVFKGQVYLFETVKHRKFSRQYIEREVRFSGRIHLNRRVTPHYFRHSFATHLIENTGKIKAVSKHLGHFSTSVTQDMYNQEQLDWEEIPKL